MTDMDPIEAAHAVLIEVGNVLGAFRDDFVVVGGWVPELRYPNQGHMGSLDVDVAVARTALGENVYQTILQRMLDAGYSHHMGPTHFTKQFAGLEDPVKVDLITGQYVGGDKAESMNVDALRINTLRGLDLAFEHCDEMQISGRMPDGVQNKVRVRVVRPEAFILIKAFAMDERDNAKDAYDIAFVLRHFQPDVEALAKHVPAMLDNGLAAEGFELLQSKFATLESMGPARAAEVAAEQGADYEQEQRAAFEYAQALFQAVEENESNDNETR